MNLLDETQPTMDPTKLVVRIVTSAWQDGEAVHLKKTVRVLKRKSTGINFLREDATNLGVLDVMNRITNLNSVDDGIYSLDICNEKHDWETGCLDDYDYKLIPI